jgi:hypothetical protein
MTKKNDKKKRPIDPKKSMVTLVLVAGFLVFVGALTLYSKRLIETGQEDGLRQASVLGVSSSTVSNGVIEVKVGLLTKAATIPEVYEVQPGSKAVCLDVEVKNISGSEKKFIPLEEITLVAASGATYQISGVLTCAPGVGGPMQVGEVLQGRLGFLIPDKTDTFELHYIPLEKNTKSFIISNI